MKKVIIGLTVIAAVGVYSCSKEKPTATNPTGTTSHPVMVMKDIPATNEEKAGYYHNLYLAAYYDELSAVITTKQGIENLSQSDFTTAFAAGVTDDISGDNAQSQKSNSNISFANALDAGTVEDVISDNITIINNSAMNSTLKTYLVGLIEDGEDIETMEDMEDFTNDAFTYINSHFQSTNKSVATAAVWVYRYSFTYWHDNIDNWRDLIDPNDNEPDPTVKLGKYGSADMSGFTSGATTGAILGGSVTVGTFTAPGWLVGGTVGAISNSLGAMVGDLWDWLWS